LCAKIKISQFRKWFSRSRKISAWGKTILQTPGPVLMRHDVTTWRLQVNKQQDGGYRRWAHSLVDPIGRRGNPRPCAVCTRRRAREPSLSPQPSPPLPFRNFASLLSSSPFHQSPLYSFSIFHLSLVFFSTVEYR